MISHIISKNEAGQRFDKLLQKILKNAAPSFVYKMLRKKNITLNGKKAEGNEKVAEGDEIRFFFADETYDKFSGKTENTKENAENARTLAPGEIVYEDKDILIVNKPAGELTQKAEASDVSLNERVVTYVLSKEDTDEAFTPSVCNRIDRNTSGLVIAGKSLIGLQDMALMLKNRDFKKYYLCIATGKIDKAFEKTSFFVKDEKLNKITVLDEQKEGAEKLEAAFSPLIAGETHTLLAVELRTGKPHQIRGQLAFLGHPLAGDIKYGGTRGKDINVRRQMLHAFMYVFPEDTLRLSELRGKCVSADPPADFLKLSVQIFGREETENAVKKFKRTKGFGA
ncbi:MAG: RluA family pseudouridine synthase [Lachnospiraceae bacterium]|nr:RluA family pseudouridine synthase [Lachnospiraceae bacterium]